MSLSLLPQRLYSLILTHISWGDTCVFLCCCWSHCPNFPFCRIFKCCHYQSILRLLESSLKSILIKQWWRRLNAINRLEWTSDSNWCIKTSCSSDCLWLLYPIRFPHFISFRWNRVSAIPRVNNLLFLPMAGADTVNVPLCYYLVSWQGAVVISWVMYPVRKEVKQLN